MKPRQTCSERPRPQQVTSRENAQVALADLTDNPQEYYGQSPTVGGAVARIIEPNASVLLPEQATESEQEFADQTLTTNEGVLVVGGASVRA